MDGLWKHVGHRKMRADIVGVRKRGECYVSTECIHDENEASFLCIGRDIVLDHLPSSQ